MTSERSEDNEMTREVKRERVRVRDAKRQRDMKREPARSGVLTQRHAANTNSLVHHTLNDQSKSSRCSLEMVLSFSSMASRKLGCRAAYTSAIWACAADGAPAALAAAVTCAGKGGTRKHQREELAPQQTG